MSLLFRRLVTALVLLAALPACWAASLKVTVKDPSGAVLNEAAVRVLSEAGVQVGAGNTNPQGSVEFPDLANGKYRVESNKEGFEIGSAQTTLSGDHAAAVEVTLKIVAPETSVEVTSTVAGFANSDPNYRLLRANPVAEAFVAENITLKRDLGEFTFRSGTIAFTRPVGGRVFVAVFNGEGHFHLKPNFNLETRYLQLINGSAEVEEDFDSAVLVFTDKTLEELKKSLKTPASSSKADDTWRSTQRRLRQRFEIPTSFAQYQLQGDSIRNLDAELLSALYNPQGYSAFTAYIHGRRHADLRFFLNTMGALQDFQSPEEVALVNVDPNGMQDGIWYLTHFESEWAGHTASNNEDRRIARAIHYDIETVVGKNDHLGGIAKVDLQAMRDGDRVIHFNLLPNLRVSRVTLADKEIPFIQEDRRHDGSFYVVLPSPAVKGASQRLQIEYAGDKVIHNAGGGNYSVDARETWYPAVDIFRDRATYNLTFKYPRKLTLVGVGTPTSTSRDGDYSVSRWESKVPLAVAGFNYGDFKLKETKDETTKYGVQAYATSELPDYLRFATEQMPMTPSSLAEGAVVDAQNAIRCFTYWFGELPYGRIAITQQPEFNFGQSWPTLVYLPLFSFLDSTQRWMLMGANTFRFEEFIQEVTPHEVAHQWWGHLVGWSSYHDQWLSEGFADFSASLFLETVEKKHDRYLTFWERARKSILDKNSFGKAANDAGPLWMGLRLNTAKTEHAYSRMVYPKGGYVLHMLRYLMQDPKTGDKDFIDMMHDFTSTYANRNVTSEDFLGMIEKHMKPQMDLDGNKRMGWFFAQFVYGSEVGAYHLDYKLTNAADGKVLLTAKVTQSGVSPAFRVRIPIYGDFGPKIGLLKIANVGVQGNNTTAEVKVLLPQHPKKVLFNYNFDVLARETSISEY
jgi:hypothetical protein